MSDLHITVVVPREKATKSGSFPEFYRIVTRQLEDARWREKTAIKQYWTRVIWEDLDD